MARKMNRPPVVMAVDREPRVLRVIRHELGERGFRVVTAHRGADALKAAGTERPDIMLIDLGTPDMPGLEILRRLRERTSAPIIMLTERGGEPDRERGLALGANDYLEKPFGGAELSERVRAVLQRVPGSWTGEQVVRHGNVAIDLNKRTVMKGRALVSLTRTEWLMLQHLATNAGRTVLGPELANAVWGPQAFGAVPHLRVWIARLRRKLEDDPARPRLIVTVRRVGYLLAAPNLGS